MNSLKKIYDIEVTPPAGVWANIANELIMFEADKALAAKLNAAEVMPPRELWQNVATKLNGEKQEEQIAARLSKLEMHPPAKVWEHIESELDEQKVFQNLETRLGNLEVVAPAACWSQISKELDDQQALEAIERKLSNLQVHPPASVWLNIREELENKKEQKSLAVPMHYGWLKYAAAACFIAIISVTAFFILNDPTDNNTSYVSSVNSENKNKLNPTTTQVSAPAVQQQALAGIRTQLGNAYSASIEKNKELQNRYIILMTQDGNVVRMSKKVSAMADCIAGEDNSCDGQISKWQKEMASSSTVSSPDNFLDILDMASEESSNASNL